MLPGTGSAPEQLLNLKVMDYQDNKCTGHSPATKVAACVSRMFGRLCSVALMSAPSSTVTCGSDGPSAS
jgi:hypothetical protein